MVRRVAGDTLHDKKVRLFGFALHSLFAVCTFALPAPHHSTRARTPYLSSLLYSTFDYLSAGSWLNPAAAPYHPSVRCELHLQTPEFLFFANVDGRFRRGITLRYSRGLVLRTVPDVGGFAGYHRTAFPQLRTWNGAARRCFRCANTFFLSLLLRFRSA